MAVVNSSTFDFAEVARKFLDDYEVDVFTEVSEAIDEVSKEAVRKLRATSRATFGNGDYAKKWKRTLERGRVRTVAIVHGDKPTYALAHLLEHGHVTRNGTGPLSQPPSTCTSSPWPPGPRTRPWIGPSANWRNAHELC